MSSVPCSKFARGGACFLPMEEIRPSSRAMVDIRLSVVKGVSKHTIYAWKAKYGGMEVSEAEEVKHLRDENARLKKLVADLSLDKDMLQSVIRKNSLGS
jgi:hypothetical protein